MARRATRLSLVVAIGLLTEDLDTALAELQLERLNLASSPVSDEGFAAIAKLARLEDLNLRGTGVKSLTGIEGLARLTPIGDDGIRHLVGVASIRKLDLVETRATADGLLVAEPALRVHERARPRWRGATRGGDAGLLV